MREYPSNVNGPTWTRARGFRCPLRSSTAPDFGRGRLSAEDFAHELDHARFVNDPRNLQRLRPRRHHLGQAQGALPLPSSDAAH